MKTTLALSTGVAAFALPFVAFAQNIGTVQSLFAFVLTILNNYVVPIVFALAFFFFIFNIFKYFIQGGSNPGSVEKGQQFLMWSIIGFVVMFSIWGLINLFLNTLGFGGANQPPIPVFNASTGSSGFGSSLFPIGGGSGSTAGYYTVGGVTYTSAGVPVTGGGSISTGLSSAFTNLFGGLLGSSNNNVSGSPSNGGTIIQGSLGAGFGQGAGTVNQSGFCKSSDDCAGQLVCQAGSCQINPDFAGEPGFGANDGSVQQGGICKQDGDCAGNLGCVNGVCNVDSQLEGSGVGKGDGSVQVGGACASGDDCSGDNKCINAVCSPDSGLGQLGEECDANNNDECQGNLACINGTCQIDSELDTNDYSTDNSSDGSDAGGLDFSGNCDVLGEC